MRILLTNDDGIHAPGLAVLESIAANLSDDIWVVAPEFEKSGAGHSLTVTEPLRVRQINAQRYAISGTPTDCVMLAVGSLMQGKRPDLILSGVNRGANLADDVTYSGTISAAMEGTLLGIPAIAMSQVIGPVQEGQTQFAAALACATGVVRQLLQAGWPQGVLMNVNFPACSPDAIQGVRITQQGQRELGQLKIDQRLDARGFPYYWLGFGRAAAKPGDESDLLAVQENYISITPLHLDLTHESTRAALKQVFEK